MNRRRWHAITGMLVPAWLVLALLAVPLNGILPVAPWLMLHLLLLGAVSTAILVWSQHFADTLLRRSAIGGRRSLGMRLTAHTVGAVTVVTGMVGGWWPVVLIGGILVGANGLAHAAILFGQSRGSLPARFAPLVRYYIAAGVALAVGVTLGVLMARPDSVGEVHERLFIAHIGMNVLGWIGLTVIGTVALLWPTVLHTQAPQTVKASSRGTISLLLAGLVVLGLGCLFDLRPVVALGVFVYLLGLARVLVEVAGLARRAPAVSYAGWTIAAALAWFALCTLGFGLVVVSAPSWRAAADRLELLVPFIAVGFAAQILLGALSYLLPVVLGGGPRALKATAGELDRAGLLRVIVINVGILLYLLPLPQVVRGVLVAVVLAAITSFLPLMGRAMKANRRVRRLDAVPPGPMAGADRPAAPR